MGRIHHRALKQLYPTEVHQNYSTFDELNGKHSWQTETQDTFVLYPVRKLNAGSVLYFNFQLAKDMGLIDRNHPHSMNKKLEKKILNTFAIRIINEYDQSHNVSYHPTVKKEHPYMATRYLQLQHKNKTGKTSGDGRSIWNGQIEYNGKIWDVSSRGTGVTCLSPGAVEANKPLKTGVGEFGYGCGLADIDELVGTAIHAEIFHNNGINTERMLVVIDLGDGHGIGVRAGHNLFRPAHLFLHLKQGHYSNLKKATDYLIRRQNKNKEWNFSVHAPDRYDLMLAEIIKGFARFAAQLDREYIFAWLDWDGDNVLIDAGIIDYGSIRQFGLRHDEYRYDDVDRFSTNLNEQRKKARLLVQVFAQLVDFLKTNRKKPLDRFQNCWAVKKFDQIIEQHLLEQFLYQVGFNKLKVNQLIEKQRTFVVAFYQSFTKLESIKTKRITERVSDGFNRPAIFNMRHFLFVFPQFLLDFEALPAAQSISTEMMFEMMLAETARGVDRRFDPRHTNLIQDFVKNYLNLIKLCAEKDAFHPTVQRLMSQALDVNCTSRMTGDGLLHVVDKLLSHYKKTKDTKILQTTIDQLIYEQSPSGQTLFQQVKQSPQNPKGNKLFHSLLALIDGCKESI